MHGWHAMAGATLARVWLKAFDWRQDEKTSLSLGQLVREPHGIATVVFEVISTLAMLPFIYIEVCTIREYGWWGWLDFWYELSLPQP